MDKTGFTKEDWLLYFLYTEGPLLGKQLREKCSEQKKKDSTAKIYSSLGGFNAGFKNLLKQGFLRPTQLRNRPKNQKYSRNYTGYALTSQGENEIAQKLHLRKSQLLKRQNLQAENELDKYLELIEDIFADGIAQWRKKDIFYNEMIILLSLVDRESIIAQISWPNETGDNICIFFIHVIYYLVRTSLQFLKSEINWENNNNFESHLGELPSLEDYCDEHKLKTSKIRVYYDEICSLLKIWQLAWGEFGTIHIFPWYPEYGSLS
jgi:hypothetical protein